METPSTYEATIFYRQPSFALRSGPNSEPYPMSYRIQAGGREESERLALEAFRRQESRSYVSWQRVVERIESRLVPPDETPTRPSAVY